MANIPLKSIKFPDLDDTYTVPSNAGELPYNKSATYPDDTVGKALQNIGDSSAPAIIETAQGSIASFTDGANVPVKDLVAEIVPLQSGSGDPSPDNVRAISGWSECNVSVAGDNLFGGIKFVESLQAKYSNVEVDTVNKRVRYSPISAEGYNQVCGTHRERQGYVPFKPNTQYTFIFKSANPDDESAFNLGVSYTDRTNNGGFYKSSTDSDGYVVFTTPADKSLFTLFGGFYGLRSPWIYYDQFGVFEGVHTKDELIPYLGSTHTISFTSAGTVYGGRLDVTSGALTVDRMYEQMKSGSWETNSSDETYIYFQSYSFSGLPSVTNTDGQVRVISDHFKGITANEIFSGAVQNTLAVISNGRIFCKAKLSDFANLSAFTTWLANNDPSVCYELATPQTYQLTPTEVKTLLKNNNIWADTGDVTVEYVADTKTFIENLVNA